MPAERGIPVPHLKAWRLRKLLKQEELAERADVSRPTIQRGERGETLSIDNVKKIANALGISNEELRFTDPDQETPSHPKTEPAEAT